MRPLRRALEPRRLVAVLAVLVVCLVSLPGAALCVGSDGHLAVEPVGSDCGTATIASPVATPPDADAAHVAAASLHGCTDTLLGTATLQGQNDPGRRLLCTPPRIAIAVAPSDPPRAEARVAVVVPRADAGTTLSTVLLL